MDEENESEEDEENEEAMLCFKAIEENGNEVDETTYLWWPSLCIWRTSWRNEETLKKIILWKVKMPRSKILIKNFKMKKKKKNEDCKRKVSFRWYRIYWNRNEKLNKEISELRKIIEILRKEKENLNACSENKEVFLIKKA